MSEDITFCQLRTFVCAAKLGSFVKAAESLGISQPAVSDQISTLEKRLRAPLFHRRRGTTPVLTARGLAVLQDAEAILDASERMLRNSDGDSDRETIRMAIGPHLRDKYFNPLVSEVYRHYPHADIELHSMRPYEDAMRLLNSGDLDIIVSTVLAGENAIPEDIRVCDVDVALVASPDLAARIATGEARLEEQDLLVPFNRAQRSARWISQSLKEAGLHFLRPPRFLNNGDMVQRLACEGLGVAYLMPETIEKELAEGTLEVLDVDLPPLTRVLAKAPGGSRVNSFIESELRAALTGAARPA
ncbi:LysR family transcriptional regulator [Alteraurantiacibacter aquimixticola]|uniref:LysR family transcriptional regulator n=1 Tax=Alteraurantiacibacter aquimixticola TaxID=2489173 RepID=UPI00145A63DD|nr:LysR family transcriptional regulator [Alteraurantiacibacter aquimixticola]